MDKINIGFNKNEMIILLEGLNLVTAQITDEQKALRIAQKYCHDDLQNQIDELDKQLNTCFELFSEIHTYVTCFNVDIYDLPDETDDLY